MFDHVAFNLYITKAKEHFSVLGRLWILFSLIYAFGFWIPFGSHKWWKNKKILYIMKFENFREEMFIKIMSFVFIVKWLYFYIIYQFRFQANINFKIFYCTLCWRNCDSVSCIHGTSQNMTYCCTQLVSQGYVNGFSSRTQ